MNANTRQRPKHELDVETVKLRLGSISEILDRHGVQRRGTKASCPSPDHEDRTPSASIFQGVRGERLYCHSCGWTGDVIDVAEILGERIDWLPSSTPRRRLTRRKPTPMPIVVAEAMNASETAQLSWRVAKDLARVPEAIARQHILSSWDSLTDDVYDLELVLRWSRLIRGVAMFRHCTARSIARPGCLARAVTRLFEAVPDGR